MPAFAATTTAWGDGDPLDITLTRIAEHDPTIGTIELSIGARPVPDGTDLIRAWSDRYRFIAHHNAPIGNGQAIIPAMRANPAHAATALTAAGIDTYSGHPPNRNHATADQMWAWAVRWWETLAAAGIGWSVETMYVPQTRDDQNSSGGYHLSTPAEVWTFIDQAVTIGWAAPLLIDVSHLHIGWRAGTWTVADIAELLEHAPAGELHLSTNDGRRDIHAPATPTDPVSEWVAAHLHRFPIIVDEGRRSGRYDITHTATRILTPAG